MALTILELIVQVDVALFRIALTNTAHRQCTRQGGPRVLFNSHIDTVPPFFGARVEFSSEHAVNGNGSSDATIWGRGACDTKGILAAQLTALQELVAEGAGSDDVGLLYVVSEETDHSGMLKSNELGLNPEYLIVGEPTGKHNKL
jgi:acetylornithine deacetylase